MIARARSRRSDPLLFNTESTKGLVSRSLLAHLVEPKAGDLGHLGARLDDGRQLRRLGERLEVSFVKVSTGWKGIALRLSPAAASKQCPGCWIRVVLPGREQADVAPIPDTGGDRRPGLIDLYGQAALK